MKNITFPDKVYNALKYILVVVVPGFITALNGIGTIYNIDMTKPTATIGVVATFVGVCLGISCANYNKSDDRK